ncbi:hypothetical protein F2P81_012188 [Scophthalmus maximus]|uniref:Uncharacterized protein n=1 Tax=Scophthalmus maximus TaxID=52904 RepID=A0A6A4SRA3_SCOMX|nr:hypothetical protein F2P81_012188 [Scophthalmus maximus]
MNQRPVDRSHPALTNRRKQHDDSKAIVDGNLKLILGLVWTLILHYSISMPVWEGEDEELLSSTDGKSQRCSEILDNSVAANCVNSLPKAVSCFGTTLPPYAKIQPDP